MDQIHKLPSYYNGLLTPISLLLFIVVFLLELIQITSFYMLHSNTFSNFHKKFCLISLCNASPFYDYPSNESPNRIHPYAKIL